MEKALQRLQLGDAEALGEIYDAFSRPLYRYALTLLLREADAEDAIHNVFMKLVDLARQKSCRIDNLKSYLFRALRNEALDMIERRKLGEDKIRAMSNGMIHAASDRITPLEAARINEALKRLPREQREVVMLKVFDDMTFAEIAELTGAPLDTVASRYRYGMKKLEEMLHDRS